MSDVLLQVLTDKRARTTVAVERKLAQQPTELTPWS